MTLHGVLPSAKHLSIIRLFNSNASLVLNLSEFGGALFVHAILQVTSHRAVTLTHLSKHICLMRLLLVGNLEGFLLMSLVLRFNRVIDRLLVVVLQPVSLALHGLLEQDVLLTVLIHILEEVDTCLVLTAPLLLATIPLLLVLSLGQLIDHLLVSCLV